MANIGDGTLHTFFDNEVVTGFTMNQAFEIIRTAINDNDTKIKALNPSDYSTTYQSMIDHMNDDTIHKNWYNWSITSSDMLMNSTKRVINPVGTQLQLNPGGDYTLGTKINNTWSFEGAGLKYNGKTVLTNSQVATPQLLSGFLPVAGYMGVALTKVANGICLTGCVQASSGNLVRGTVLTNVSGYGLFQSNFFLPATAMAQDGTGATPMLFQYKQDTGNIEIAMANYNPGVWIAINWFIPYA